MKYLLLHETGPYQQNLLQRGLPNVKKHFDELCQDERLRSPEQLFMNDVFYDSLDIVSNQIRHRFEGLTVVSSFDVLQPRTLLSLPDSEFGQIADLFVNQFNRDVSPLFMSENS